jgi:proteasome alpha subunit
MITPYDWQEGIGNRAQYIEGKLEHGSPVVAVSLESGILVFTRRRQSRKIFELYDRLLFAAIGQQSDVEALRASAVEFAHTEGYNRSEQDVTIQRVVTALSGPVKKAFADFSSAPLVARSLFAEVGETVDEDRYFVLNYDGDYQSFNRGAIVTGKMSAQELERKLEEVPQNSDPDSVIRQLAEIWDLAARADDDEDAASDGQSDEAMLLERSSARDDRFRILAGAQ